MIEMETIEQDKADDSRGSGVAVQRLILLDLFCCEGGAGEGYRRAGFDIVGVDIAPREANPHRVIEGDALEYLEAHGSDYDFIHASPPCQGYTTMNNRRGKENTPRLIGKTRKMLERIGKPWVIENVCGARSEMRNPILLTGEAFGLRVHRPRLFETSFFLLCPPNPPRQRDPIAVYGKEDGRRIWTRKDGTELRAAKLPEASEAMGIDWMTWDGIREAIPPAYTQWIGEQFLKQNAKLRDASLHSNENTEG